MAFLGGAECSTTGNPLNQFTKHVQDDKSLQRDRLMGRGLGGSMQGMRSTGLGVHNSQDHIMNEFMQQSGGLAGGFAMQDGFNVGPPSMQLRADVQSSGVRAWAQEYKSGFEVQGHMETALAPPNRSAFSPADFANFQQRGQQDFAGAASPISQQYVDRGYTSSLDPLPMGMDRDTIVMDDRKRRAVIDMRNQLAQMRASASRLEGAYQISLEPHLYEGKGKMVELDDEHWEEQFAQIDLQNKESEENSVVERGLEQLDRSVLHSETDEFGDFESIWRGIQAEAADARDLEPDIMDQWSGFDDFGIHDSPFQDPQLGEYMFEPDNIFTSVSNPFEEGIRIMQEGGNLSLAALAFEAAVQKDPSHVQAWLQLGTSQAQNEKETPAIRAIEQALKLEPNNLTALMGLAISYTNEGFDTTAYRTLERWLSIKYPSLLPTSSLTPPADIGFTDRQALHTKITNLFISAAQLSPDAETMDPDVQVGLGVLFYGAETYAKAIDCFSAALASTESGSSNQRDQVHLLWNRLGATLANSGRSEEAIAAYERALTLKGNFVRARYNLGISCINLGAYESAAGHLLGALDMHEVVEREGREVARRILGDAATRRNEGVIGAEVHAAMGKNSLNTTGDGDERLEGMLRMNQSTNLYDTLRRVLCQIGRTELAQKVGPGMDVEAFRGELDF